MNEASNDGVETFVDANAYIPQVWDTSTTARPNISIARNKINRGSSLVQCGQFRRIPKDSGREQSEDVGAQSELVRSGSECGEPA